MTLLEFEHFPSEATPRGGGRIYVVHERVRLVAYVIDDGLSPAYVVYAFRDGKRTGYWNSTTDPADLEWVMETYRAAREGRPARSDVRDPRIRPTYNRDLAAQLRATDSERHLDVSAAFGAPEHQPDVIPFDRKR